MKLKFVCGNMCIEHFRRLFVLIINYYLQLLDSLIDSPIVTDISFFKEFSFSCCYIYGSVLIGVSSYKNTQKYATLKLTHRYVIEKLWK